VGSPAHVQCYWVKGRQLNVPTLAQRYQRGLVAELELALQGRIVPLYDMLRYHLGWIDEHGEPVEGMGGKGIRPNLCLLACAAVGGRAEAALPAAAAIELVHNFSLIHDDIEDESLQRRHRPTVWSIWGVPQAVNAGDSMYTLARLVLYRLEEHQVSERKIMRVAKALDEACIKLCEGQYLDLFFQHKTDVTIAEYIDMIGLKTGALIGTTLFVGATIGANRTKVASSLYSIGAGLGLAFQIWDDILGIWGVSSQMGKAVGEDIINKKKSLPIIYLWEHSDEPKKDALRNIYSKDVITNEDVELIMAMLDRIEARPFSEHLAERYFDEAMVSLDRLPLFNPAADELKSLCATVVQRNF